VAAREMAASTDALLSRSPEEQGFALLSFDIIDLISLTETLE
jgi:hypothetical protein